MREDDALDSMLSAHAHDPIMIFTQDGVVRSLPAYQVPEASRASGGTALAQVRAHKQHTHLQWHA